MVSIDSLLTRLRFLGLALAGAVCAHTFSYALSYPNRMARQSVLEVTGHAYWHAAVAAGAVGAAWFAILHVARHAAAGRRRQAFTVRLRSTFAALAGLQLAIFAGMEASERVASGAPMSTLLDRHVLVVGLALQVLVAAVIAAGTYLLARVAHTAGCAFAAALVGSRRTTTTAVPVAQWPVAIAVVPCGTRGPPSSLS